MARPSIWPLIPVSLGNNSHIQLGAPVLQAFYHFLVPKSLQGRDDAEDLQGNACRPRSLRSMDCLWIHLHVRSCTGFLGWWHWQVHGSFGLLVLKRGIEYRNGYNHCRYPDPLDQHFADFKEAKDCAHHGLRRWWLVSTGDSRLHNEAQLTLT